MNRKQCYITKATVSEAEECGRVCFRWRGSVISRVLIVLLKKIGELDLLERQWQFHCRLPKKGTLHSNVKFGFLIT